MGWDCLRSLWVAVRHVITSSAFLPRPIGGIMEYARPSPPRPQRGPISRARFTIRCNGHPRSGMRRARRPRTAARQIRSIAPASRRETHMSDETPRPRCAECPKVLPPQRMELAVGDRANAQSASLMRTGYPISLAGCSFTPSAYGQDLCNSGLIFGIDLSAEGHPLL